MRNTSVLLVLYGLIILVLLALFLGKTTAGVHGWFDFGAFSFQPADIAKVILVLVLAKYFSRRHVEIAHYKHIFISGLYTFCIFVLVALQPDFGSAIIIGLIWFGMIIAMSKSEDLACLPFA